MQRSLVLFKDYFLFLNLTQKMSKPVANLRGDLHVQLQGSNKTKYQLILVNLINECLCLTSH